MARSLSLAAPFSLLLALAPMACGGDEVPVGEAVAFDPCQPLVLIPDPAATAAERDGIAAGAALWNALVGAQLTVAGADAPSDPALPVHFQTAAAAFHGFYDASNGQVFINTDLGGNAQAVTIAHEIGHAFGLAHVPSGERASVMNPGNLNIEPNADDAATLALRWGACREPASP
jgi:hypothetical protein